MTEDVRDRVRENDGLTDTEAVPLAGTVAVALLEAVQLTDADADTVAVSLGAGTISTDDRRSHAPLVWAEPFVSAS